MKWIKPNREYANPVKQLDRLIGYKKIDDRLWETQVENRRVGYIIAQPDDSDRGYASFFNFNSKEDDIFDGKNIAIERVNIACDYYEKNKIWGDQVKYEPNSTRGNINNKMAR